MLAFVSPPQKPTRVRYVAVGLLSTTALLAYLCRNTVSVAESTIRADLGLTPTQMGWIMGSFFWSYALLGIAGGWLGHLWGTRRTLTLCMAVWAVSTMCLGWAPGLLMLLAAQLLMGADGLTPYLVKRRVLVSGENLTRAGVGADQSGRPAIDFRFDGQGARRFGETTAANIGRPFAIILDGKVISAPTIQGAITGGTGQITGSFSIAEASELVNLLNGGALPAPLTVEERRTVTAELGADAVAAGALSTAIGFVIILVFMILAYGFLFGGVSVIGLALNGLLIIAAMSLTQATLTLPGIAGLILTFAVAVDANVLIYERMRDEARAGRSVIASMDAGFNKAWGTILDANITTLVAALIMFIFGAGPVRGFAWTLTIGVFTSVFSAVLVSQVLLAYWLKTARPKKLPIAE